MSGTIRAAARGTSGRRERWLRPVAAATVPAVLATLAVLYPGAPVQQVDLNDGAVWLTNTAELRLGRYNPQVDELNAGLIAGGAEFDVLQDEGDVLLEEEGRLSVVDPASVTLAAQAGVPTGATVSLAGGTVVVADGATGNVWARPTSLLGSLDTVSQDPDLVLTPGGVALAAPDGALLAVDPTGVLKRAELTDPTTGGVTVKETGRLADGATGPFDQVTAVGDVIVVLTGGVLSTPFGSADLTGYGEGLVVQQAGPSSPSVLVATRTALLDVPLDGGSVLEHRTGGSGRPAAPVRVGACGHGAWASASGSYLQLCGGEEPEVTDLDGMTTRDALVFRVNRDVVALNDTLLGRLWLPLEDPELREPNWQDVEPREKVEEEENESQRRQSTQNLQADCSAQSAAPAANDDEYGVRAGRTAILSVIDNDTSSECGILTISEFDPVPEDFGTLVLIHGGHAFQLETLPGARGTVELTYTISDGRGNNAPSTATVRLTVRQDLENAAPVQLRVGSLLVEQGASATYDVLPDFRDPDGDHLILADGVSDTGETVRTRQDGQLTFTSDGASLGRRTIQLHVSDGSQTVEGSLLVDVRPVGSLAPVIDPVQAVTYVDDRVVVRPLDSVRSASREPARLAGVDDLPGATVERDLPGGTFTFSAARAGTYYVSFLVTSPPQQATGVARIDVLERPEEVPPPTAVLDVALLPPGGEVTIAPLANDIDPGGAVLVLQSVEVTPETGLRAAVLNHELVRLTATRVLEGPVTARYTISNGVGTATGTVLVQLIPASAVQQPPVVPDVRVSVRTGGVVTIPVLEGAYDPDGDVVRLVPQLAEPLGESQGLIFVSGDVLRYQAPQTPMEVRATFDVTDSVNETAGTVTITVHASEASTKAPPRPPSLTARVFQGETIRIDVPLTGIDPDGDGVALLGQDTAPAKGRITAAGPDWLEYEALPGELGTDTFTYAVEDWVGQRAVGTVRVGIAPRPTTAAQVVTRNDDVTVRPGSSVEVRVLANDVDTGGGDLALEPGLGLAEGVDAEVVGSRIVVRTPTEPAVLQISYTAVNLRGGRDSAVLTVTVTPDATVQPPVARDVIVPASETINRTSVEVDVLAVAQNPSGPLSDLAVSVDPSVADVATVTSRGTVTITLGERARTLPYRLTNTSPAAERLGTYAFITVPALGDFPPMLRPGAPELRVIAGEPLRITLAEQVQVAPGRTARLGDISRVSATKSEGSPVVADGETILYTAQRSYAGPASISFEVTDGDIADPTARIKLLTLPISVLAAEDYPPTFSPSVIDVAPGESSRVDLTAFTSTAVGTRDGETRYTYRLRSSLPSGFEATLDGSVLTVRVGPTVAKGTVGGVAVEVGYGGGGTLPAQVDFRVVASQRPLARVRDHVVPDGVEGVASTVSVLDGAFNPFADSPLTLVGAVVETPGAGAASASGPQVTVRPGQGFIGTMVTRYRVRDVTGDPDRDVEGRVVVTVRGRPAAPGAPRVVEVRDRTVVLAWDAPATNGEPITGYRLTAQPGGLTKECESTTCTFDGLSNNTEYRFSVTAVNAVDWSDPSPLSPPARPDARPSAPQEPSLTWGDRSVAATWEPPQNPGSPITRYDIEISPAPPAGPPSVTTTATSYTFGNLANGTEYIVRVRAVNAAPDPGDWSPWSSGQVPAATPAAPAPTATRVGLGHLGSGRIDVSWPTPAGNGDTVAEFQVVVNGAPPVAPNAGATSHVIEPAGRGEYKIEVRARNKAGWGEWGTTTGEIWTVPVTMAAPVATSTPPGGGSVELAWSAPDSGGAAIVGYQIFVDGVGPTSVGLASRYTVTGLDARSHSFQVRACNSAGCGAWSTASTAEVTTRPGDVRQLQILFDDDVAPTTVRATWVEPADTGGLSVTYRYRFYLGDSWGSWQSATGLSSPSIPLPNLLKTKGGEVIVQVYAVNTADGRSPTDVEARRTVPEAAGPPPTDPPPTDPPPTGPPPTGPPVDPPAQP